MTFKSTSYSIRNYGTYTSEELNLITRQKPAAQVSMCQYDSLSKRIKEKLNHNVKN